MPSKRNPAVYFLDIHESIERIESYLAGLSYASFEDSMEKQDAVNRRLQIVTEASGRLRPEDKALCTETAWNEIRGLNNRLKHDYDSINPEIVWRIVHEDLPRLKLAIEQTMGEHFPNIPLR